MTARVTISLPDDLLVRLDAIAEAEGVTRSDVVREAAGGYVTSHATAAVSRKQAQAVDSGLTWLEEVAAKPGREKRSGLEILRELRGAPLDHSGEGRS